MSSKNQGSRKSTFDESHRWQPEHFSEVYQELRTTARAMRRRNFSGTLNTTAIVHEAWLRYLGEAPEWSDRKHFFASAAAVMRQLLVDHARQRSARKRCPDPGDLPLFETSTGDQASAIQLLALDQALNRLEKLDQRLVRLVELRTFAGLTIDEVAEVLNVSPRTLARDWVRARAFLKAHLEE